ncbi:helix-turn-helix domain-containing protein [Aquimarina macrocephali]|uniref:helix-turn-helix domain-containing protein n=1 Tax=Aquimarina macrocephali TaxID=666563 RepID=UPI000465D245|nr:helix-turn-helix domain-containing protein [Aquimarina macrocephali]
MDLGITFFLTTGIVINAIILLLLIKSKTKESPQRLLLLFFSITLFYIIHGYAQIHKLKPLFLTTFVFNEIIEFFTGPLIFVYIKSLFEGKKKLIRKYYIHFVPTLLYLLCVSIPFLISIIKKEFVFNYLKTINDHGDLFGVLLMMYFIFYTLYSLKLFNTYKSAMKLNFSNISENDFGWVKRMLIGVLVISCLDVVFTLYETNVKELNFETTYLTLVSVIILIAYLGYYGVKQSKILLPDFLINTPEKKDKEGKKNEYLSGMSDEELNNLKLSLEHVMFVGEKYLDEDLTLSRLASAISISDKKLSTFLNQYLETTFYDYVNKYRVASVKEKMKSSEYGNITLLGIAYESGFKSKTSFNRIFKKETGLSPSQFKSSLQKTL